MVKEYLKVIPKKGIGYHVPFGLHITESDLEHLQVNIKERRESINIGPFLGIGRGERELSHSLKAGYNSFHSECI